MNADQHRNLRDVIRDLRLLLISNAHLMVDEREIIKAAIDYLEGAPEGLPFVVAVEVEGETYSLEGKLVKETTE